MWGNMSLWNIQGPLLHPREHIVPRILTVDYTRRQINLYRMFFDDFSVNSQPIFMKFCMDYLRVTRRQP